MKCILHIGTEKTGSTAIQLSLERAREGLESEGIRYVTFGQHNVRALAAAVMDLDRSEYIHLKRRLDSPSKRRDFRKEVFSNIQDDIDRHLGGCSTFLLSAEHFHSALVRPSEVSRLRNFLAATFEDISVIMYVRPQVDVVVSRYSTRLRAGDSGEQVIRSEYSPESHYFNYDQVYQLWAEEFGSGCIDVRDFTATNDVVEDFCAAIQVRGVESIRSNERFTLEQMEFLRLFNRHYSRADPAFHQKRENLISHLEGVPGQRAFLLSRSAAEAFQSRFEGVNASLLRKLNGREKLFTVDFSRYPESISDERVKGEQLFNVFARLLESPAAAKLWNSRR